MAINYQSMKEAGKSLVSAGKKVGAFVNEHWQGIYAGSRVASFVTGVGGAATGLYGLATGDNDTANTGFKIAELSSLYFLPSALINRVSNRRAGVISQSSLERGVTKGSAGTGALAGLVAMGMGLLAPFYASRTHFADFRNELLQGWKTGQGNELVFDERDFHDRGISSPELEVMDCETLKYNSRNDLRIKRNGEKLKIGTRYTGRFKQNTTPILGYGPTLLEIHESPSQD
ncbi:Uncharacterised protein [uncultured archaeon]|nr:Uncharacterised protein [uncultured archaeon]